MLSGEDTLRQGSRAHLIFPHDLNQEGQITNRSNSFTDHRNHARFLWRLYKGVVEDTEDSAWGSAGTRAKPSVGWQGVLSL